MDSLLSETLPGSYLGLSEVLGWEVKGVEVKRDYVGYVGYLRGMIIIKCSLQAMMGIERI